MSMKIVQEEICRFLESKNNEVLSITGEWGVGKTFTWKKLLIQAKKDKKISHKKYSYVSLFGIESLDALKFTIFENLISSEHIGVEPDVETIKNNLFEVVDSRAESGNCDLWSKIGKAVTSPQKTIKCSWEWLKFQVTHPQKTICSAIKVFTFVWRKIIRWLIPSQPWSELVQAISFMSVQNAIICIDDLERTGIPTRDIMGLASLLKEQKDCKVVFLLNRDEIKKPKVFGRYAEKVIDIELMFDIASSEAAELAFKSSDNPMTSKLSGFATKLEIKNIRILQQINRLSALIAPLTAGLEEEVVDSIISSLVLFAWSKYSSDKDAPDLDFFAHLSYGESILGVSDDDLEAEAEKRWKEKTHGYGYSYTNEVDLIILQGVKCGYFNKEKFSALAATQNEAVMAGKGEKSFTKAWDLYHNSFEVGKDELIKALYDSFHENIKYITPINLDGTVRLFKELDEAGKALKMISLYVDKRGGESELFDPEQYGFFDEIKDEDVMSAFKEKYTTAVTEESAESVLERISGKSGWNKSDEVVLANTTIEEFYKIFKESGEKQSSYVRTCLKFRSLDKNNETYQEINRRVVAALTKLGTESELNALRVRKYGVEPPK